ncbi:hypothetical protein [Roseibium sp. MMSF_3412]|uniref:hypothetical protein n=1 Tax=Roseibium sp. MMSF_3412 TaxID=3046712 RepID=UPI00273DB0E7|nr:hypothetical protein [Roseibium sp. MMSF_3412]
MKDTEYKKRVVVALEKMAAPPSQTDEDLPAQIERIQEIASAARSSWFWFSGILGYALITLMGVADADFFSATATTKLPVLDFDVNLKSFLVFGPILFTILYAYLHGLIEQAWYDLSLLPAREGNEPIASKLPVWLIFEFALYLRRLRRKGQEDPCVRVTPLGFLGAVAMAIVVWLGAPVLIALFWFKSMIFHELLTSGVLGFCLWLSLLVCWLSIRTLWITMGKIK